MEKLNSILQLLTTMFVLGFFSAGLGMVFQSFMQPNMIFYPWAVFLMKLSRINEVWRHITRPLGRCRYCNGTWISIYIYQYFFKTFDIQILLIIVPTWFWLKIFSDYMFPDIDANGKVEAIYKINVSELPPTPVVPMLKSYVILGSFYSMVYIGIPFLSTKLPVLLAKL
jgi:hypothetical protein